MKKLKIAIDGPCAAGKTTMAKLLAKELDVPYIDTGSLYRAVAYFLKANNIAEASVVEALPNIQLKLTHKGKVWMNGLVINDAVLRTPEIAMCASNISAVPEVRNFLLETQRKAARENGGVMEGRDTTTVVMPNADMKFYLTAAPLVRAKRRMADLQAAGTPMELPEVLAALNTRDYQDMHREIAPLKQTDSQIYIDNSHLSAEQTFQKMLMFISGQPRQNKKEK